MSELKTISNEIKEILKNKRDQINLTFEEEEHKYTMLDKQGNLRSDFPSVSSVLKYFYTEFDSHGKSLQKAGGDPAVQEQILSEWAAAGSYATNLGSRVHYHLEMEALKSFDIQKDVRKPIFECDDEQIFIGNSMIQAGIAYINLMRKRGAILLDTETVLGSQEFEYVGQPDKCWLMKNKEGELGFIITDWKTNKKKNFEVQWYTIKMKSPFEYLDDTALSHYFLQLPFYARLILDMLKGSKYENVNYVGGVVVLLKDDSDFVEYKIPKEVVTTTMQMNIKNYLK